MVRPVFAGPGRGRGDHPLPVPGLPGPTVEELDWDDPLYHAQQDVVDPASVELPDDDPAPAPAPAPALAFAPITHEQASELKTEPAAAPSLAGKAAKVKKVKKFKAVKVITPGSAPPIKDLTKKKKSIDSSSKKAKAARQQEEEELHEFVKDRFLTLSGRKKKKEFAQPQVVKSPSYKISRSRTMAGRKRARALRTTDPDVVSERVRVPYKTRKMTGSLPDKSKGKMYDQWL